MRARSWQRRSYQDRPNGARPGNDGKPGKGEYQLHYYRGRVGYRTMVPWVPWYPTTLGTHLPRRPGTSRYLPQPPRCNAPRWRSGLKGPSRPRAGRGSEYSLPCEFPHVRSSEPGHQDRAQVIRDKCWIGSRSDLARLAWPAWAWLGRPGWPRSPPRAPGALDPGHPGWPRSLPDPGSGPSRAVLARPLARILALLATFDRMVG